MTDRFRPSSLAWLRLGVVLAVALPIALFAAVSWMAHREAERNAVTRLDDLARVMEEHAERVFDTDSMVIAQLLRVLGELPDAAIRSREAEFHDLLSAICERLPQIGAIAVFAEDGRLLVSSRAFPVPRPAPRGPEEYRGAPTPGGWSVSPLVRDPVTREAFFRVSQPRVRAGGAGAGLLELSMRPAYFTDYYRRLSKPHDEVVFSLLTGEGYVVARWPGTPEPGMRAERERYGAFRSVGAHALFVSTSQPPEVVFQPWRRQIEVLAAIAFPSAAALLYASLLALRRTRRAMEIARELQEESAQRQRAEEALRHSQKMEALGELTGGVAHDFNNLMMVVNNNAYLLASTVPQAKDSPQLASILRAIESGTRLTRQLLAFARRQPLHPQVLDLHRALPGMAELIRSTAGGGVKVGLYIAPDTPPVLADPAELEMALINLAANARDAMNRSGELEILARGAEPGEGPDAGRRYVLISVSDTGHGIRPENLSRVFDPFFTTKPPGSGTGLGLSQVYGFCHQAGGGVQLESEVGLGTTVSLFLPATDREAANTPDGKTGEQRLAARVLLVEDNTEVSATLGSLLKGLGCSVGQAASVAEAEAMLAGERFDVVLSDIIMPGEKDGIAFALALRERRPPLAAVLMTGYARETARARGAGIEVLQKPCSPQDVAAALARALGRVHTAAA